MPWPVGSAQPSEWGAGQLQRRLQRFADLQWKAFVLCQGSTRGVGLSVTLELSLKSHQLVKEMQRSRMHRFRAAKSWEGDRSSWALAVVCEGHFSGRSLLLPVKLTCHYSVELTSRINAHTCSQRQGRNPMEAWLGIPEIRDGAGVY